MIVTQLLGGLGNQLFQYATARAVATRHGTVLKLDTSKFDDYGLRTYELKHFSIEAQELSRAELRELDVPCGSSSRVGRIFKRLSGRRSMPIVRERNFGFDPSILDAPAHCYLQGYWQSFKYFEAIEPVIRQEFTVSGNLSGRNAETADQILGKRAVSVHIRRGDYASNEQTNRYHGTCSPEYYYSAEKLLRNRVGDLHLFVFSDDPKWASENLRFSSPTVIMSHNAPDRGHEDLRLMTMCHHHILANSTFSWWGAWLSKHTHKVVIAPKKWFREAGHSTEDLIPKSWITL